MSRFRKSGSGRKGIVSGRGARGGAGPTLLLSGWGTCVQASSLLKTAPILVLQRSSRRKTRDEGGMRKSGDEGVQTGGEHTTTTAATTATPSLV